MWERMGVVTTETGRAFLFSSEGFRLGNVTINNVSFVFRRRANDNRPTRLINDRDAIREEIFI